MPHQLGPTRLLVRDAFLLPDSRERLAKLRDEGLPMVETKTEVSIDRGTGRAAGGALHTQERIPKGQGTQFAFEITVRVFKGDNEQQLVNWVKEGLALLGNEALGGSGSRGYGWVNVDCSVEG
jgi:CRISPR-associated protein Csm3